MVTRRKRDNIKKLANGRFRARYFRGYDSEGKRVCPSGTFDTQREAQDWLKSEKNAKPGSASAYKMTVAEMMDRWLTANHKIRESSRRAYETTIERYIKPHLGEIMIRKLSVEDIDSWQAALLKHKARATITGARRRLFTACRYAVKCKWLSDNPVANTDSVGVAPVKKPRHLTTNEAREFLAACDGHKFGLMFELTLRTGLRISEVTSVTWSNLHLDGARGVLRIEQVITPVRGGGWKWTDPKSENGKRLCRFPAETAAKFADHRRRQLEAKLQAGPLWRDNDLVFSNRFGGPVAYRVARKGLREILNAAGLPESITPHKLRHAFVTQGLESGTDVKTVSREVGHHRPSFTLDFYGEPDSEMFDEACDRRERLLRQKR